MEKKGVEEKAQPDSPRFSKEPKEVGSVPENTLDSKNNQSVERETLGQ